MPKPRYSLATTAEDAVRYRDAFVEFSRLELASGGPDHHLRMIARLVAEAGDPAGLLCCYMGPYNVPGGLALYPLTVHGRDFNEDWLRRYWRWIPVRRERRPCRSPHKMAEYLDSALTWSRALDADVGYEELWDSLRAVRYVGRYAGMKLLEAFRRAGLVEAAMPDLRAGRGGDWSTRLGLSYLYPEYDELLNRNTSKAAAREVEALGREAYAELAPRAGISDAYTFEVLLCDFKQALDGRYYPGRPLDSELEQLAQARPLLPHRHRRLVDDLRIELFPREHLGERGGWSGRRPELGETYNRYGYWWSDLRYDYVATGDPARPVRR